MHLWIAHKLRNILWRYWLLKCPFGSEEIATNSEIKQNRCNVDFSGQLSIQVASSEFAIFYILRLYRPEQEQAACHVRSTITRQSVLPNKMNLVTYFVLVLEKAKNLSIKRNVNNRVYGMDLNINK
jgi:hypothetical protein